MYRFSGICRASRHARRLAGFVTAMAALPVLAVASAALGADAAPPWTIQATRNPGSLDIFSGVSCPSATRCVAAGFEIQGSRGLALAELRNGRSWQVLVPVRRDPLLRTRNSVLTAASCPTATRCELVGVTGKSGTLPLAALWNGKLGRASISSQRVAVPPGSKFAILDGVSCTSVRACTAVGFFIDSAGVHTLVERRAGLRWRIQASGTTTGQFNAVSCSSARFCMAVGDHGSSAQAEFVGVWSGGRWLFPLGSNFNGAAFAHLNGVSCTADGSCVMVGITSGPNGSAGTFALALKWIRGQFFLLTTANPSATVNELNSVWCTSAANCLAVGEFQDFRGQQDTLAENWDGARWAFEATPNPLGTLPGLTGVSCSAPGACAAVGSFKTPGGKIRTLAERFAPAG